MAHKNSIKGEICPGTDEMHLCRVRISPIKHVKTTTYVRKKLLKWNVVENRFRLEHT